jgi:hypothetical protein
MSFTFGSMINIEPSPESISNHQSPRQVAVVGADEDYSYEFSADSSMFNDSYQCIRFQAFQQNLVDAYKQNNPHRGGVYFPAKAILGERHW